MKNVRVSQVKKCIFMELEEFEEVVNEVTGGLKKVSYECDGIFFEDTDKAEETEEFWNEEMTDTLSRYYDVEVTSIHADDCEIVGIWICYR